MSKLDNIKIFNSPITNEVYLCSVNSKNLITEKRKLNEQDMMEFIFGIVKTLENKYGGEIVMEDDVMKIKIETSHRIIIKKKED